MTRYVAAPANEAHWRYEPAPKGIKCRLLNPGFCDIPGPASGEWGIEYIAWAPLIQRDKERERELGFLSVRKECKSD